MFSGIVEEQAVIVSSEPVEGARRLVLESALEHSGTKIGDSICVEGVCLTVVQSEQRGDRTRLSFDLSEETLRRSTLGTLPPKGSVHLERSLAVGDRLHGHFVFGHVDGTAELKGRHEEEGSVCLEWGYPIELSPFLVPKGSVSLSGVSLTLGEVTAEQFTVYIVPHTSAVTWLGDAPLGARANIEVDMLARYVHGALGAERVQE